MEILLCCSLIKAIEREELGGLFPTQKKTGLPESQAQLNGDWSPNERLRSQRATKTGQKEAQKSSPKGVLPSPSLKKRYLLKNTRIPAITPTRTTAATTQPMMMSPSSMVWSLQLHQPQTLEKPMHETSGLLTPGHTWGQIPLPPPPSLSKSPAFPSLQPLTFQGQGQRLLQAVVLHVAPIAAPLFGVNPDAEPVVVGPIRVGGHRPTEGLLHPDLPSLVQEASISLG
ncbi:hypothetical protein E2320_022429 [Naja naja]|nr:hypothetical protein E2320_022429 [Naja naja]